MEAETGETAGALVLQDQRPTVSIGIFAHEHERLLDQATAAFASQRVETVRVVQVVVVSPSAAAAALSRLSRPGLPVEVLVEPARRGKSAAINDFLSQAVGDIVVIASGDVIPEPDVVEHLAAPLLDGRSGMTGPRIEPVATTSRMVGRANRVLWELHDAVARRSPKLGEVVAARRSLVPVLPDDVACDEVVIEATTVSAGLSLCYVPDAVVHNIGPDRWTTLFAQRRRIHCQHLVAHRRVGYAPATLHWRPLVGMVAAKALRQPRLLPALTSMCVVETAARLLARWDYRRGREYRVWTPTSASQAAVVSPGK